MRAWAWPKMILCLAACASVPTGKSNVRSETRAPRLQGVEIRGNRFFSDQAILEKLWIREARRYDPVEHALDEKRIEAFYRERGYFSARVRSSYLTETVSGTVNITFVIDEGLPTRVVAVRMAPVPIPSEKLHLPIRPGDVLVYATYEAAKESITATLVGHGYAHARVHGQIAIDRDRRQALVELLPDSGPRVHFGRVHVRGLVRIPLRSVRSRVAFREGDLFSLEALERTQAHLNEVGYFQLVRLRYEQDGRPATADVTLQVAEGGHGELHLGAGFGVDRSRRELHARIGYLRRGALHPLVTFRTDFRPGFLVLSGSQQEGLTGEAMAALERDDFLVPRLRLALEGAYSQDVRAAFTTRGPRVRVALDARLDLDRLALTASWQLRYLRFLEVDPVVAREGRLNVAQERLGYFEQSVAYDLRDSPLDARHGVFLTARLEEGGVFAAGRFSYVKFTPELRFYLPLPRRIVLATRVRLGLLHSFSDEASAPTQRYLGGGGTAHRGFSYQRLSPSVRRQDGKRIPIGGNALWESSMDLRWDVLRVHQKWVGLTAFLDGGDVTSQVNDLALRDLHWAIGLGLRYETVVAPLRLDVGVRLNRVAVRGPQGLDNPDPGDRVAVHLSVGEAF